MHMGDKGIYIAQKCFPVLMTSKNLLFSEFIDSCKIYLPIVLTGHLHFIDFLQN